VDCKDKFDSFQPPRVVIFCMQYLYMIVHPTQLYVNPLQYKTAIETLLKSCESWKRSWTNDQRYNEKGRWTRLDVLRILRSKFKGEGRHQQIAYVNKLLKEEE